MSLADAFHSAITESNTSVDTLRRIFVIGRSPNEKLTLGREMFHGHGLKFVDNGNRPERFISRHHSLVIDANGWSFARFKKVHQLFQGAGYICSLVGCHFTSEHRVKESNDLIRLFGRKNIWIADAAQNVGILQWKARVVPQLRHLARTSCLERR